MSVERSPSEPPAAKSRRWKGWILAGILIVGALTIPWVLRKPAPPPPTVDTTGFDPAITDAIEQARQEVIHAPRSADARGRLGMVLLAHGVNPQAGESFTQAAALAPREPRWLYLLGLAQLPVDAGAAATNFDRAVRLLPQDQLAPRLKLADTWFGMGRTAEAEAQYRAVFKIDPNCAPAQLGLGKAAIARGSHAEAAEFLTRATRDPVTRKAAHRLLLNVFQRLGRTNEIEQIARALSGLAADQPFPDPYFAEVQQFKTGEATWLERAEEWIKAGRTAEAAALLEKMVRTYPKSDRALFLLGRARLRLGDQAGAEAVLSRATELAPGSVEAQVQLGIVQLARGRSKEAQRAFRAAIDAKPNLAEAWFNLGLSLGNESRPDSIAAFREAIRLKPNFPEAFLALAVVLRAEGQPQAAASELRHAMELQPTEAVRQKLLAQLRLIESQ